MTQTTDVLHDTGVPEAHAHGTAGPYGVFAPPTTPPAPPVPPLPPAPPGERPGGRGGRGPGRAALAVVAVGAAVLSSLLTAGAVTLVDGGRPAVTSVAAAPSVPSSSSSTVASGSWTAIAAAVEPSVVTVATSDGEGSGVVLDTAGHVLTNNHVVAGAGNGSITVTLSDGRAYPASVVGTDPSTDLAVLVLKTVPSGLKPATFGDSAAVKVGDQVMAIGNPLGLSSTVTTGIVSAVDRPVSTASSEGGSGQGGLSGGLGGATAATSVVTNAIQTDAAINPGNSGGALINTQGQVVGITSSIASLGSSGGSQSGSIGLGFAIPANEAKDVAQQLISGGSATHAYLGVSLADGTVTLDGAQRQAAVVQAVTAGTPAAQAGLAQGDAVTAIDGHAVEGADSLVGTVRALRPGTKVTLTVARGGSTRTVALTLATAPTQAN